MPKALKELIKCENLKEIKEKMCQFFEKNYGYGFSLDELEFFLSRNHNLGIKIGGKFFLYKILRDLIREKRINSIVSKGHEYFFIDN